jgi:hypothetical protein
LFDLMAIENTLRIDGRVERRQERLRRRPPGWFGAVRPATWLPAAPSLSDTGFASFPIGEGLFRPGRGCRWDQHIVADYERHRAGSGIAEEYFVLTGF